MRFNVEVSVNAPKNEVWQLVSDIEHAADRISGIESLEILEKPAEGMLGLKWQETRTLFGNTATETMWITDVVDNDHYITEARSHGSIYKSKVYVSDDGGTTRLGMDFAAEPQTFGAKVLSATMGFMFKGTTRKCLLQDLEDIKAVAEGATASA